MYDLCAQSTSILWWRSTSTQLAFFFLFLESTSTQLAFCNGIVMMASLTYRTSVGMECSSFLACVTIEFLDPVIVHMYEQLDAIDGEKIQPAFERARIKWNYTMTKVSPIPTIAAIEASHKFSIRAVMLHCWLFVCATSIVPFLLSTPKCVCAESPNQNPINI